jgi:N-acetylglucosamine-6-sulfatase
MKDYLRCIRALDEGIGRILDTLDQTGLSKNTIVIYASDQGFYLGEHGWYDKRWMFEESMKMPFIVRWPGVVEAGSRPSAMIQNFDYAPTFLDLAGATVPKAIQGRSLKPVLEGSPRTPPGWRDALYYAYYGERTHAVAAHDGIRTERYKLIHYERTSDWNLFDLKEDPQELHSVDADPAYSSILEDLTDRYRQLRRDYQINSAVVPVARLSENRWKARFDAKQAIINDTEESVRDIVFIGDSITQGFEDAGRQIWTDHFQEHGAINLGFNGDRTEHVIWRLYNGDLSPIEPKVAVVLIGTNNTGHRMQDADETALGINRITEILGHRWPGTEILLLNLFPRGETPEDPKRRLNREIGERIKELGHQEGITFLDIGHVFLESDGTINRNVMPDFLHLSPHGYRLWSEAMSEALDELLEKNKRKE